MSNISSSEPSATILPPTIQVGQLAPEFVAMNQKDEQISLKQLLQSGQKVMLVFYPADMTPGCTKQLCGIRDTYSDFQRYGVTILGINKAGQQSHQRFIDTFKFPFDILVDSGNIIRDSYGAVKKYFNNIIMKRGVVLIGTDGKVLYTFWGQQDNQKLSKCSNQIILAPSFLNLYHFFKILLCPN